MPADLQSALVGRLSIPAKLEGQPTVFLQRAFWNKSKFALRANRRYYLSLLRVKIFDFDEQKGAAMRGLAKNFGKLVLQSFAARLE
jgi:hypothetical protein